MRDTRSALVDQSEGWNGCNGSPWMRYGYGVERASLHFQGRASPSDLIGSGMYREVWDCRKTDLEARQRLCTGILVDETRRAPGSVGIYGPLSPIGRKNDNVLGQQK